MHSLKRSPNTSSSLDSPPSGSLHRPSPRGNHVYKRLCWLDILPSDCTAVIRDSLAHLDYEDVLHQLEIATTTDRIYISTCETMEGKNGYGIASDKWQMYNHITRHNKPSFFQPSTLHIINDILSSPFIVNQLRLIMGFSELSHTVMPLFAGGYENSVSFSGIFPSIWVIIESTIELIHTSIDKLRVYYKQIAIPQHEYNSLSASESGSALPDTHIGFKVYVMTNARIAHSRTEVFNLLNKMYYNCGHLRSVRYRITKFKKLLYTVYY